VAGITPGLSFCEVFSPVLSLRPFLLSAKLGAGCGRFLPFSFRPIRPFFPSYLRNQSSGGGKVC
jgi:hypothetical protein